MARCAWCVGCIQSFSDWSNRSALSPVAWTGIAYVLLPSTSSTLSCCFCMYGSMLGQPMRQSHCNLAYNYQIVNFGFNFGLCFLPFWLSSMRWGLLLIRDSASYGWKSKSLAQTLYGVTVELTPLKTPKAKLENHKVFAVKMEGNNCFPAVYYCALFYPFSVTFLRFVALAPYLFSGWRKIYMMNALAGWSWRSSSEWDFLRRSLVGCVAIWEHFAEASSLRNLDRLTSIHRSISVCGSP